MKKLTFASITAGISSIVVASQAFAVSALCPSGSFCDKAAPDPNTLAVRIIDGIFVLAAILAVIFLVWGGIKYITAGGDKTKVTAARETIIGAIVGLIVAFAAFFIINFVLKLLFGTDLFNSSLALPQGILSQ